jgi:hypothetical protein
MDVVVVARVLSPAKVGLAHFGGSRREDTQDARIAERGRPGRLSLSALPSVQSRGIDGGGSGELTLRESEGPTKASA